LFCLTCNFLVDGFALAQKLRRQPLKQALVYPNVAGIVRVDEADLALKCGKMRHMRN
jgi:ABC-type transporter Mla MlaB component